MKRILAMAMAGLAWSATLLADGEVVKQLQATASARGIRQVRIEIPIAEIEVRNGPANAVELSGTIRQRYDDSREREWASEIVDATHVTMSVSGDVVFIRRETGPEARGWRAKKSPSTIKAVIAVPEGVAVDLEQSIGEVDIDGSFGGIDLSLKIGDVTIRVPKKDVRTLSASAKIGEVRTNLGDRVITKEGLFAGETYYENESGRGSLTARVQIGEIKIDLIE